MNKKDECMFWKFDNQMSFLVGIGFGLVLLMMFYGIVNKLNDQEFKITIEEYHIKQEYNETLFDIFASYNDEYGNLFRENWWADGCEEYFYENSISELCHKFLIEKDELLTKLIEAEFKYEKQLIDKEICEQVEVEEGFNELSIDCRNESKLENGGRCKSEYTMTQYLSIEWLDENCECEIFWNTLPCPKGYEKANVPNVVCNAGYKDSACQKYKCGSYNVEVLK